jgi:hypothetical protein
VQPLGSLALVVSVLARQAEDAGRACGEEVLAPTASTPTSPRRGQALPLVLIGVRVDGIKELITFADGYRESGESWAGSSGHVRRRPATVKLRLSSEGSLARTSCAHQVSPTRRHLGGSLGCYSLPVGARLRAKRYRCGLAVSGPQRGHFEDSIYFGHANNYWVAAVPPGDKAGTCPEVTGRAKTEVRPRSGKCDATWTGRRSSHLSGSSADGRPVRCWNTGPPFGRLG